MPSTPFLLACHTTGLSNHPDPIEGEEGGILFVSLIYVYGLTFYILMLSCEDRSPSLLPPSGITPLEHPTVSKSSAQYTFYQASKPRDLWFECCYFAPYFCKQQKLTKEMMTNVTKFGKIWPLWQKFTSLWQIFDGLFVIWQNAEPTVEKLYHCWAYFQCCKWPNIEKFCNHLVALMMTQKGEKVIDIDLLSLFEEFQCMYLSLLSR